MKQQRVTIVQALANNPAIVLPDEVIKKVIEKPIWKYWLLGKSNKKQDASIVISTYNSQLASIVCRVPFLFDGKLLARERQGTYQNKQALK